MTRVTIGSAILSELHHLRQPLELCDESGQTLGYFTPVLSREMYDGVDAPISEEELNRRVKVGGGRILTEILADLEKTK